MRKEKQNEITTIIESAIRGIPVNAEERKVTINRNELLSASTTTLRRIAKRTGLIVHISKDNIVIWH